MPETMKMTLRERVAADRRAALLLAAQAHLARAVDALQIANEPELRDRAYVLTNDVLKELTKKPATIEGVTV
jgi:hypothetical protein